MVDTTSNQRLEVSTDSDYGPYMYLPATQLDVVTKLLDRNNIVYRVDDYFVSINDEPEVAQIYFDPSQDPLVIQRIFDIAE